MIKDKTEFYDALWNDYFNRSEKDRTNSFICCYIKKNKDARAETIGRSKASVIEYSYRKRRDKYILLKSAYLAVVRYDVMTVQEYSDILKSLLGAKLPAKYMDLSKRDDLDKAETMFERRFLMGCVNDYFYNLGYRSGRKDEYGQDIICPNRQLKEDGYNDELEMLYEFNIFSERTEIMPTTVHYGEPDDEYIGKCTELYDAMIRENRTDAFVPLHVDRRTGAGIYIIGSGKFDDKTMGFLQKKDTDICYVCIIYFDMLESITRTLNMPMDEVSISMFVKKTYRSVKKAFDDFSKLVSEQILYEQYPYENDGTLPKGIDAEFNLFFLTREENEEYIGRNTRSLIVENTLNEEAAVIRQIKEKEKRMKTSQ